MRSMSVVCILLLVSFAAQALPQKARAPAKPQIDVLFAQLAKAESPEDAKPIEERIYALFVQSGSPSVDLLMARGAAAMAGGDTATAKTLFASVTDIAPKFAEGWHQWAQLQSAQGDDRGALISLQKTVTLNPRQFEAMSELADMLEDYGDKPAALEMYKRALSLDPQLEGAARHLRSLSRAVEGQGI